MVEAGENPRFIFRRMLISAGEDIGLADPQAMVVVEACAAAFERVGLPEGLYPLAQQRYLLARRRQQPAGLLRCLEDRPCRQQAGRTQPSPRCQPRRRGLRRWGGLPLPPTPNIGWSSRSADGSPGGETATRCPRLGRRASRAHGERRAAQLAAAVELAAEQPLLLSSGSATRGWTWIQRQLGQGGERLDTLRQRLWQGLPGNATTACC